MPQGLSELGLDPEIVSEFVIEGTELLAEADVRLLALEKNPLDGEAINAIFRAFHTIKGLAGFLNLEEMQNTAHAAEDLLDRARSRAEALHGKAIDLGHGSRVIMTTVSVTKQDVTSAFRGGADGYLTKPVNLASLTQLLRNLKLLS